MSASRESRGAWLRRRPPRARLMVARVRWGLWVVFGIIGVFAVAHPYIYPANVRPLYVILAVHAAILLASLWRLHDTPTRAWATRLAVLNAAAALLLTAATGIVVGDDAITLLLSAVMVVLSAALMPWGFAPHLWVIASGLAASLLNTVVVQGGLPRAQSYRFLAAGAVWSWTVFLLYELRRNRYARARAEHQRRQAERAREREARISAALARVGRELIASLRSRDLLDRLCQTTVEVLGADFSHTWLWDTRADAVVAVAGYGDRPEIWESLRALRIPREAVVQGGLAQLLASGSAGQMVLDRRESDLPPALHPVIYGLTVILCTSLRRGTEMIGAHVAGYRDRDAVFTAEQRRIANGIAQLASMALEYTLAMEQLEKANRLKSEFVANMSHELCTPINIIQGYADLSLDGEYGEVSPDLAETLRRILQSANALQHLVNDTLSLARLDTGQWSAVRDDVRIDELVAEVDADAQPLRNGIPLHWQIEPGLPALRTDATKLKVVLRNLLSNALKFTPEGRVCVAVQPRSGGIEFAVQDTGVGIAPELHEAIFEPFRQGDGSSTRSFGGTGLGLHITRRLVAVMGGRLEFESAVGKGSTFRVWLPASPSAPAAS